MRKFISILISLSLFTGICHGKAFDIFLNEIPVIEEDAKEKNITYIVELEDSFRNPSSPMLFSVSQNTDAKAVMTSLCNDNDTIKPGFVYSEFINGFSVTADEADLEKILNTPGVKAAYESAKFSIIEPMVEDAADITEVTYLHEADGGGYTGAGEVIAIIDSEFDTDHEFFAGIPENPRFSQDDISRIVEQNTTLSGMDASKLYLSEKIPFAYDYGESDYTMYGSAFHGSHVAGIAAGKNASPNGNEPLSGIAPDAQLIMMKISDANGEINMDTVLKALNDAIILGADCVNLSLGIDYSSPSTYPLLSQAISLARSRGITVCCAAGNSDRGYQKTINDIQYKSPVYADMPDYGSIGVPSAFHDAIAVGSTDKNDTVSYYTSWGVSETLELKPDISVTGRYIKSSNSTGGYVLLSGTSMAAPHMTGITALMSQYLKTTKLNYTAANKVTLIENLLMSTADVIKSGDIPVSPRRQGAGRANVRKATETKVVLKGVDGRTKMSLGDNLSNELNISFKAVNMSDTDITFTPSLDLMCDNASNGIISASQIHITPVSDTLPDTVTAKANGETNVSFTVTIDPEFIANHRKIFKNGFFIDGFLYLTHESEPSLSIPFTGFFGDRNLQSVFDKSIYDEGGSVLRLNNTGGTYLFSYITVKNKQQAVILGCDASKSTPAVYDKKFIAISPNGDGYCDYLGFSIQFARMAERFGFKILNSDSLPISNLGTINTLVNKYYSYSNNISFTNIKEGDYALSVTGTLNGGSAEESPHTLLLPFTVDKTVPQIKWAALSGNTITVSASDNHLIQAIGVTYKNVDGTAKTALAYPDLSDKNRGDTITMSVELENPDPDSIVVACFDYAYNYTETNYSDIYTATIADNTLSYRISENSASTGGEVIFAFYTSTDKLVCIKSDSIPAPYPVAEGKLEITDDISSAQYCKIFIWNSLGGAVPLIPAESVKKFTVNP